MGLTTWIDWLVLLAVAGAILVYAVLQVKCLRGWRRRYRLLGVLPLVWLATWGVIIANDMTKSPPPEDLWPFEVIAGAAPSLVLLLILMMLHFVDTGSVFETPDE